MGATVLAWTDRYAGTIIDVSRAHARTILYVREDRATLTIGGLFGAPTAFPASMPREDVISAIRKLSPEVDVSPVMEGAGS